MKEEERIEGNKLIVDFMESNIPTEEYELYLYNKHKYQDLEYHSSWDWLLPVVQKIKNVKASEMNRNSQHSRRILIDMPIASHIRNVYDNVVSFIHWNNQPKDK